jgi:hypothetical protein
MVNSKQSLNNLTIIDLEKLIETIVKRTLKQESNQQKSSANNQALLNTFGT